MPGRGAPVEVDALPVGAHQNESKVTGDRPLGQIETGIEESRQALADAPDLLRMLLDALQVQRPDQGQVPEGEVDVAHAHLDLLLIGFVLGASAATVGSISPSTRDR